MRLIIPIAALLIAILSVSLDLFPPSPASPLCRYGACRFDQIFRAIDAAGATPKAVSTLVDEDPANPLVWCTYAQVLSAPLEQVPEVSWSTRRAGLSMLQIMPMAPFLRTRLTQPPERSQQ